MRMVHIAKQIVYENDPTVMSQSDIKNIERQIADRLLGESYDHRNKPNYSTIATARMDLENILTTYEVDLDDLNNNNNSNPDLSKEKFQTLVSSWKYIEEKEKELEGMLKLKKENDPNIQKVLVLNDDTIKKIYELNKLLALEGQEQDFKGFLDESLIGR